MVEGNTVANTLKKILDELQEGDLNNPFLDAQLLMTYVLNVDKTYLFVHRDQMLEQETVDRLMDLVKKRKKGYPLQYIIGKQEFMGLDFYVEPGVLVPRPDTEILVESIIDRVKTMGHTGNKINIVDIGTGSGAIALSLAYYIKGSYIYAIDISDKALNIANKNCKDIGLEDRVVFLKGNLINPLEKFHLDDRINIIVSNPPYIKSNEIAQLQTEVSTYEPKLALDGGDDGLDYYREIIPIAKRYLINRGILAFEIGYDQGDSVSELMKSEGYVAIDIIKDLAGMDRVVIGKIQKEN